VALNGAVISQDDDDTRALYGEKEPFSQILTGKVRPPAGADKFLATVKKYSAEAKTNAKADTH
jgi:lipid-binding SYLF domain-containing protein